MPITSLHLTNIGPFDDIEFKFDSKINVFIGPNNCGKTSALTAFGDIIVIPFSTPEKFLHDKSATYEFTHKSRGVKEVTFSGSLPLLLKDVDERHHAAQRFERIKYTCFVPALRRGTNYRSKGPGKSELKVDPDANPTEPELEKRYRLFETDPSLVSDEAVIQKIIDIDYKAYREAKPSIRKVIDTIAEVTSKITEGFPIKFHSVGEDKEGLFPMFSTNNGNLPLNVLSQGTQSIIQWVAYFLIGYAEYYGYTTDFKKKPAILIVDEIDAHLHPSWQRRILPTLRESFPQLQIFCSTHSPLMLAGLEAGQIQLLDRDKEGNVTVSTNEFDIMGWSVDEILSSIQQVTNPTDVDTHISLRRLNELRRKTKRSKDEEKELKRLRNKIGKSVISDAATYEIEHMASRLQNAMNKSVTRASQKSQRVKRKA